MRLATDWETDGDEFGRSYSLEDGEGNTVESFDHQPTLDTLREAERRHAERIDVRDAGFSCTSCGDEIGRDDRFGADFDGNLLCWDCAMDAQADEQNDLIVNTDPAQATLSESKLHEKSLCDYVINVTTGCRHGCKFCYVPTTPAIEKRDEMLEEQADVDDPQTDWGSYLLYRDDLPERLHDKLEEMDDDDWKHTDRGRGVVMLSSGTDCYQDRRAAQITRACVQELVEHGKPVRILTRSPAVVRDRDLFEQADGLVRVGSSIPSLDASMVKAMESGAPPPMTRWEALDELRKAGVPIYISMSPTYPMMDEDDLFELLSFLASLDPEVVFHEPINPRGQNFQMCWQAAKENGRDELAAELQKLQDKDYWVDYALNQIDTVQKLGQRFGTIDVHSWPDRELIQETSGELRDQLRQMRKAVSPETVYDELPETAEAQAPFL